MEKPIDAEDHRVRIYYSRADGGGMKELFARAVIKAVSITQINRISALTVRTFMNDSCRQKVRMSRCILWEFLMSMLKHASLLL